MTIELCLSLIGVVTGVIGTVIGIFGVLNNRYLAIRQYMEGAEKHDFIEARTTIRNTDSNQISLNSTEAAQLVNFLDHWGLLAKKHYLPLWVFDSGSGAGVIRYYDLTQGYIAKRRERHRDYASNFEWLYCELQRREKKKRQNNGKAPKANL